MEPSPGGLLLNGAPTLPGEGGGDGVGEGEGVGEGDGVGEPPSPAEGTVEVESTESVGEGGRAGGWQQRQPLGLPPGGRPEQLWCTQAKHLVHWKEYSLFLYGLLHLGHM